MRGHQTRTFLEHAQGFLRPLKIHQEQMFDGPGARCAEAPPDVSPGVPGLDERRPGNRKAPELRRQAVTERPQPPHGRRRLQAEASDVFADPQAFKGTIGIGVQDAQDAATLSHRASAGTAARCGQ